MTQGLADELSHEVLCYQRQFDDSRFSTVRGTGLDLSSCTDFGIVLCLCNNATVRWHLVRGGLPSQILCTNVVQPHRKLPL
mmetsp:Transcript_112777/g.273875  ORF Transcript_112777/g.273875 Transcript_112777/m.273875 type:complete len:81 (-) Transcript_112777:60-302(-)